MKILRKSCKMSYKILERQCIFLPGFLQDSCKTVHFPGRFLTKFLQDSAFFCQVSYKILARQCIFLPGFLQDSCKTVPFSARFLARFLQDSAFFCQVSYKILSRQCILSARFLARFLRDMQFLDCCVQHLPKSPRSMLQPRAFEVLV